MKRLFALVSLLCVLGASGYALAGVLTTGTVSVCSAASVSPQTVQLNGSDIATIPGASDSQCATTTYTVPTTTETTTVVTGTTATVTIAQGGAAPFVASAYISPGGFDVGACTASAPCATPQFVCSALPSGGTVEVRGGEYTVGFNLNGCNPASTLTYRNTQGAFVTFAPQSTIASSSNVTLQGDFVGHGVGFSLAQTNVSNSTSIDMEGINFYCQAVSPYIVLHSNQTNETACNSSLFIAGSSYIKWNAGDQEDWAVCLTTCTHAGSTSNPNDDFISNSSHILVSNITQKNYYGLDSSGLHSEEWFLSGGDYVTLDHVNITDCGPPAYTGYAVNTSCNSSVIFLGQLSGTTPTTNHLTISNSTVDGGHVGQKGFQSGYDYPAGTEPTFKFINDSFTSSLTICGVSANVCGPGTQAAITGVNMVFANVVAQLSSVGCFRSALYSHNDWFATANNTATCGPTDAKYSNTPATFFFTSPGPPNFNDSPTAILVGRGDPVYCTASPCNIGAQ